MLDQESFYIIIMIDEGEIYNFGEVMVISQIEDFDLDYLVVLLLIQEGNIYQGQLIEDVIDMFIFVVGVLGYVFVNVCLMICCDCEICIVDVEYVIDEGLWVYIECIDIVNNMWMLDCVICCELNIVEGDVFNCVLIDCLCNNVCCLGFFEEVEIIEMLGFMLDCVCLMVDVMEQLMGELVFGVGFFLMDVFLVDLFIFE